MKSEPDVYSIDDLAREKTAHWDGVRNYQARNFMRDQMKIGDRVLFYHSNSDPSGIAGTATVAKEAQPDFTAWDKKSHYFDERSTKKNPVWFMVEIQFESKFPDVISLNEMKKDPKLKGMIVVRRGMRLSIQPVEKGHFDYILKQAKVKVG